MTTLPMKDVQIRIRSSDGKIYFTIDDIQRFPEFPDGPFVELIHGELYLMPPPTVIHQKVTLELAHQIKSFLEKNPIGEIFTAPIDVVFSKEDLTIPDIIFISKERNEIIKEKNIEGIPDFIIEIVSTNKKQDYIKKKQLYEKYKIKEYWIIDPEEKLILTYILDEKEHFKEAIEYSLQEIIEVQTIPGLKLKLK